MKQTISICFLVISVISYGVSSFEQSNDAILQSQKIHLNRFARHAGFGKAGMNACCNVEETDAQKEYQAKFRELKSECSQEVFGDQPGPKNFGRFVCIAECMGKKTKIIDDAKNFNEEEYRNMVNEMAFTEHHKAIADETATKCIEEVKKAATDDEPITMPMPDGTECNKLPAKAYFCAKREFLKSCPAESQDTSDKCVEFRKMLESGHLRKRFDPKHGMPGQGAPMNEMSPF